MRECVSTSSLAKANLSFLLRLYSTLYSTYHGALRWLHVLWLYALWCGIRLEVGGTQLAHMHVQHLAIDRTWRG